MAQIFESLQTSVIPIKQSGIHLPRSRRSVALSTMREPEFQS
jgi:hypothetical protein